MTGITRHNSLSNHTPVHGDAETPKTDKNYIIYGSQGRTSSKSAKSKFKNLAYTLSRPFRFLMKGHIEKSIGARNSMDAMKKINAPTTSNRKTETDSMSSSKTSEVMNTTNSQSTYEIVGRHGGERSAFSGRLWG